MKKNFTIALFLLTLSATAQKAEHLEFSLAGGIKRNQFEVVKKDIAAFNATPTYNQNLVTPTVKNSYSFFAAVKTSKKISERFSLANTGGLDMQQLNIESGLKKQASTSGITSYKREYTSTLIPRLKLDFGFTYDLIQTQTGGLSVGLAVGQMIKVSNAGSSYSFVEANISAKTKNLIWFVSGSLSPYNVTLPNFQNYFGNLGADVIGDYEYRVYDIAIGAAIKL